jgi:hypothetical protein
VSDGTLASFCGSGDGFVRTWYDQSGNGRDAGQATQSDQAQIVSGGSLITYQGVNSISFDQSTPNTYEISGSFSDLVDVYCVANYDDPDGNGLSGSFDGLFGNKGYADSGAGVISFGIKTTTMPRADFVNDINTSDLTVPGNFTDMYLLSILVINWKNDLSDFRIGKADSGAADAWDGQVSELVVYPSQTNGSGVRDNMNNFYSLY